MEGYCSVVRDFNTELHSTRGGALCALIQYFKSCPEAPLTQTSEQEDISADTAEPVCAVRGVT
jgi:hypothetical protein